MINIQIKKKIANRP